MNSNDLKNISRVSWMTLNHQTNNKQLTVFLDIFELHGIFATFFPSRHDLVIPGDLVIPSTPRLSLRDTSKSRWPQPFRGEMPKMEMVFGSTWGCYTPKKNSISLFTRCFWLVTWTYLILIGKNKDQAWEELGRSIFWDLTSPLENYLAEEAE